MEPSSQRWIVKDVRGRIFGPFSTERMVGLIKRAVFSGDEKISSYPDGDFKDISKIPKFYDLLLETLATERRPLSEDEKKNELTREQEAKEPASLPRPESEQSIQKTGERQTNRAIKEQRPEPHVKFHVKSGGNSQAGPEHIKDSDEIIDLQSKESLQSKEGRKKTIFAILLLLVGAVVYFLLEDSNKTTSIPTGQIELLYPKQKRQAIAETDGKKQLYRAVQLFQQDTFSNYYRAMNILVDIIESGYPNVEALSMLCLTQRELWAFANQDSKDLMAIAKTAQLAAQKDPVGVSGATCRVVQYFLGGQTEGASSLTDSVLNDHPTAAAFYEFKAQVLASSGDYSSAVAYLEKAQQLWPQWLKLSVQKAAFLFKQGNPGEAAKVYREVLKQNGSHPLAKINLGELEYFVFKHSQDGIDLIRTGLESDRLIRSASSRGLTLLAVQSEREQKNAEAIEFAGKAYALDPTNLSAKEILRRLGGQEQVVAAAADRELVALGEEYVKKGNNFAAQAEFKSAYELNPSNGRAAMLAAQSLWELNQSLEAIDWARKAVQSDKNLIPAYVLLADYYSQRFDFRSAALMLQTAQKIAPQSYQVVSGFALVELRRYNYKGAVEAAKRALKMYDTDIETHMILASACMGLSDSKCAYETMSKAISLDANNRKAQSLYAEVLAGYQGVDAAIAYLKNLINTYPQQVEYKITMAKVLIQDDRMMPAIEALKEALAHNDKNKQAHILMGRAFEKSGDTRSALKSYLSAAALDPADVGPTFMAGELYTKMNDFQKALAQFEQVVKINQMYPRAHVQLGKTALMIGNIEKAAQEATLEKRINPGLSDGYVLAGDVYMSKKDFRRAATEYQRAIALHPEASTYILLARSFRLSENLSVASSLLAKAIKLEDGNPDIYKEQGAIFEGRGEKSEAILAYQKYLQLLPNASDRQIIEQRIKGLGGP